MTGTMLEAVFESDPPQESAGPRRSFTTALVVGRSQRGHEDILENAQVRQQVMGLEDETDRLVADPRERRFVEPGKVLAVERESA